jgi:hypothetical protein
LALGRASAAAGGDEEAVIIEGTLIAAGVVVVAVTTGRSVRRERSLTLNGLRYRLTRYGNDKIEVAREDGLRFTLDAKDGPPTLTVGTRAQFADALAQLRGSLNGDAVRRTSS